MSRKLVPVRFGTRVVPVAAVAFDKDGTLLQTQPFWHGLYLVRRALMAEQAGEELAALWEAEMGAVGGQFDRRGPYAVATQAEEVILLAGLVYRNLRWSWERCRQVAGEIFHEANRQLDLVAVTVPRPGVVELIHALKQSGVAVGIVTSDEAARTRAVLGLIGLPEPTWDFLLTPADVKRPKPAPDMVLQACRTVGCTPAEIAVVGDAAVDMKMARSAGALGIAVPEEAEDEAFLRSLADMLLKGPHEIAVIGEERR